MNTIDRDKEIDDIFNLVTTALRHRLTVEECTDKDIAVALKFLGVYEAERLPQPGVGAKTPGNLPFPRTASN